MPPTIASAEVGCPAAAAFVYTTDPSRFCEWQRGVVSGHMENAGPDGAAHCVTVRKIGFAERASTAQVVRADPPRSWSVRGIDGPIRAMVDVDVAPLTQDRCRVSISVDFRGHGIGRLLVPLVVRRQAAREMPANLRNLTQRLQALS